MTTITNKSKNSLSLSNEDRSMNKTWDNSNPQTWDDSDYDTWDDQNVHIVENTKNSLSLTNKPKV